MSESLMSQVEKVLPQHWANKLDSAPDEEAALKAIDEFHLYGASIVTSAEQLKFVREVSGFETKGKGVDLTYEVGKDGPEWIILKFPIKN